VVIFREEEAMVYFKKFQVICLKCGSDDVDINNVGSGYQLTCLKCDNWEDENE